MLVADDVEVNRASLRSMFEQEYEVLEAENGMETMDILRSRKVDIVILDICVPILDSGGVLSWMKADSSLRDIPVIVKTSMDEHREIEMLKKGADDFIFAPCEPSVIINRVKNIVDKYVFQQKQFQKKLEEEQYANRVRESFITRVSKEMRDDAKKILALCGTENENELSDVVLSGMPACDAIKHKICGYAQHLVSLSEVVLEDTQMGAVAFSAPSVPFRLQDVVEDVSAEYAKLYQTKEMRLEVEKCRMPYENLVGDCRHFRLLWRRLLKKAYDNGQTGNLVITGCRQREVEQGQVELELRVRGDVQIQDTYLVAESLVELLRGTMNIRCEGENSSAIVIQLPFAIGKQPLVRHKHLGSMHGLAIDDNELTRNYHTSMLMRLGITCDIATNGADAVRMLKRADTKGRGYDLCFVNWYMLGGEDIVREIRGYYTSEQMLIVCSTNEKAAIEHKMKEAGVDYVAERPIYQATLYQFLTDICNGIGEKETREDE